MCEAIKKANIGTRSEARVLWLFPVSLGTGSILYSNHNCSRIPGKLGLGLIRCLKTMKRPCCSNRMWNRESSRRNRAGALGAFLLRLLVRKWICFVFLGSGCFHFPTGIGSVRRKQKPHFFICNPKHEKYVVQ